MSSVHIRRCTFVGAHSRRIPETVSVIVFFQARYLVGAVAFLDKLSCQAFLVMARLASEVQAVVSGVDDLSWQFARQSARGLRYIEVEAKTAR